MAEAAASAATAAPAAEAVHPILVTGATGTVGQHVYRELKAAGARVVACVRDVARAASQLHAEPDELIPFDFLVPDKVHSAFSSTRPNSMFLMRPPALTDVKMFRHILDEAAAAGCQHVVFLSLIGVEDNSMVPHHAIEGAVKDVFGRPGRSYTMLRPGFFMQNLSGIHAVDIRERDEIFVPAGNGRTSFIDVRDIAAVGAAALLRPAEHAGKAYDLTGSQALTYMEVAAIMTEVLGRKITYASPWSVTFAARMSSRGLPLAFVFVMCMIYAVCWTGNAAGIHDDVRRVLGRDPITVRQFVTDFASAWAEE